MATGDHDWAVDEVVSAANMDDYLQLQVVGQYATAAARDTALSARKREGMVTYQIDTNTLTVYTGAAWSTVGPVHGALPAWVPAIVQSGGVSCTVTYASYSRVGRTVFYSLNLSVTGAGSANNLITVTLPVTAASSSQHTSLGHGYLYDNSGNQTLPFVPVIATTTTMKFLLGSGGAYIHLGQATSAFTAALASSDIISATGWFEAAADA